MLISHYRSHPPMPKTHNEEDEAAGDIITAAGLVQLVILTGVLIAWLFTPLYALETPVFSVSLMPWGIVLKAPSTHQVLYAGTVRPILWFLLADLALLVIGVFTGGIVAPATYLLSTGILFIVNSYQIPLAGILAEHLFYTQLHELAKDPTLLTKVGNITVINGQESVLLPMHIVNTLYCALVILMLISFALSLTTFSIPRH
jgi:signal transduction histidine kinase